MAAPAVSRSHFFRLVGDITESIPDLCRRIADGRLALLIPIDYFLCKGHLVRING
jgi:hypothetical protein